eukprot:scaffold820_cov376-Prasinococcus_capsulatus_cf.AAC.10
MTRAATIVVAAAAVLAHRCAMEPPPARPRGAAAAGSDTEARVHRWAGSSCAARARAAGTLHRRCIARELRLANASVPAAPDRRRGELGWGAGEGRVCGRGVIAWSWREVIQSARLLVLGRNAEELVDQDEGGMAQKQQPEANAADDGDGVAHSILRNGDRLQAKHNPQTYAILLRGFPWGICIGESDCGYTYVRQDLRDVVKEHVRCISHTCKGVNHDRIAWSYPAPFFPKWKSITYLLQRAQKQPCCVLRHAPPCTLATRSALQNASYGMRTSW